ncbi:MAG TPA: hypothetical protein PK643_03310 [Saprospiraceae bacterium]|nr:hypothetical protein [Saprospiraceae bacterium]
MIKLHGSVPVKRYLLKYALATENLDIGEPLDLKNCGIIGFQLKLLLTNKTNVNHEDDISINTLNKFDARLTFIIHAKLKAFNGFFISRKSIVIFNSFLHQLFHEELLRAIIKAEENNILIADVIHDFMNRYGIEEDEDISFDAVKKANYRLRNSRNMVRFRQPSGISG